MLDFLVSAEVGNIRTIVHIWLNTFCRRRQPFRFKYMERYL